jgi:uncharacterized protein YndB with AHSA1/START domain
MIDVIHTINAVKRQVGSRLLDAGEARTTTIGRTYDATIEDLWDACTKPERIPQWFLPISGELRLGGRYQLEGHAGGTIERCDPPHGFAATWEFAGDLSWIDVQLTAEGPSGPLSGAEGPSTRFELEHVAHITEERWTEFGPGAAGVGWDMLLMGLGLHLASGEPVNPEEVAAWGASDEGRQFVTMSSQAWCDASIAAGTDPQAAAEAAARTTAAYLGI